MTTETITNTLKDFERDIESLRNFNDEIETLEELISEIEYHGNLDVADIRTVDGILSNLDGFEDSINYPQSFTTVINEMKKRFISLQEKIDFPIAERPNT